MYFIYFYTLAPLILLTLSFSAFPAENTVLACDYEDTLSAIAPSLFGLNLITRGVRKSASAPLGNIGALEATLSSSCINKNLIDLLQRGSAGVLEQYLITGSFPVSLQSIKQYISQKNILKLLIQYGAHVEQNSLNNYGFDVFDKFTILGKRAQVFFEIVNVLLTAGEYEKVKHLVANIKTYFTFDQELKEDLKTLFDEVFSDKYAVTYSGQEATEKEKKEFQLMQRVLKALRNALLEEQNGVSELALALKQLKSPTDKHAMEELEAIIMRTASYAVGQGHKEIVALFVYLLPELKPSLLELVESILARIESEKVDSIISQEEALLLQSKYNEIKTVLN